MPSTGRAKEQAGPARGPVVAVAAAAELGDCIGATAAGKQGRWSRSALGSWLGVWDGTDTESSLTLLFGAREDRGRTKGKKSLG